ncbi:hypothetical protein CO229_02560 [Mycoplasmopsis bovirhinis]|uniref:MHJ_0274 family protein n=1 Tax=Mycoplasmopsis bovirhinis TaxID=29553 RepID=UPI000BB9DA1F|nr:hypothetical protein [Mycoplasmopsis bovirhinis]ATO30981.1 hypothetical protein CO229_02560 [Mycoplasmopsis bovirhinis]BBA22640.1 hypothetical protein MBVR141_1065 [Mycoplasmopsis bovirhinis]
MNNKNSNTNSTSSVFGTDSSIIIWVILGILILLLLAYILYSYIKEKINAKKTKEAAMQLDKNAAIYYHEVTVKINELIKLNTLEHSNFVVSVGKYKMSHLNYAAAQTISDILEEYEFKNYIVSSQKYETFIANLKVLRDLNSNLWDKKLSQSSIKYFNDLLPEAYQRAKEAISSELTDLRANEILINEIKTRYLSNLNKDFDRSDGNESQA